MSSPHITVYLDPASPFAYLSLHLLLTRAPFSTTPLTVVPVSLLSILSKTSNTPPIKTPAKLAYLRLDRLRICRRFSIPFRPDFPKKFPINSVPALCVAVATGTIFGDERMKEVVWGLAKAQWEIEGGDLEEEKTVRRVLQEVVGVEGAERVWSMREGEEVEERLRRNTEEAVGKGAFGVPWIVVEDGEGVEEVVWGVDHLDVVAEVLGGTWPPRKDER